MYSISLHTLKRVLYFKLKLSKLEPLNNYPSHWSPKIKEVFLCSACLESCLACSSLFQLVMACSRSFPFLQATTSQNVFTYKFTINQLQASVIIMWDSPDILQSKASAITKWGSSLVLQSGASGITKQGRHCKVVQLLL